MDKIYNFTNENVTSYETLYDFNNARVLSVLGSGDQYFAGVLYDASDIDVFDLNPLTWDYFVLKFYGIKILSYEEFYYFFVYKRMNDLNCFKKLCKYLPFDVKKRLSDLYQKHNGLSFMISFDSGDGFGFDNGTVIPYFDKDKYYQLQALLRYKSLPTFYLEDFLNLPNKLNNKGYDIILASNIFYWVYYQDELSHIPEYKELLNRFNYKEIQALYFSGTSEEIEESFKEHGFEICYVPPASSFSISQDTVISLRKK